MNSTAAFTTVARSLLRGVLHGKDLHGRRLLLLLEEVEQCGDRARAIAERREYDARDFLPNSQWLRVGSEMMDRGVVSPSEAQALGHFFASVAEINRALHRLASAELRSKGSDAEEQGRLAQAAAQRLVARKPVSMLDAALAAAARALAHTDRGSI
jgi:hypothetical protein